MSLAPLRDDTLTAAGIRHGFFTREGGVSGGIYASLNCGLGSKDSRANVLANRARVAEALCISPSALVTPYQVHGATAIVLSAAPAEGRRPEADALVTSEPGLAIGVGTADCGPILFADRVAGVIGVAHAGWRGALAGILESTVAAMVTLGASAAGIHAVLGPTISQRSYEVGDDFKQRFLAAEPNSQELFVPAGRPGHALFDLPGFIGTRLAQLKLGSVADLSLCTYRDPERFFSFRRATHQSEPDYGRMLAAIALPGAAEQRSAG
ncbi:MAG: peptidoglycan editing factor PgeF [Bauldia sp.]